MFKSINLNYVYNVEYFADFVELKETSEDDRAKQMTEKNKNLFRIPSPKAPSLDDVNFLDLDNLSFSKDYGELSNDKYKYLSFSLKTTYPGLVAGIGVLHEVGLKGEFSLGFNFDYVTGAFYIPASTVKGILKSAFENGDIIRKLLDKQPEFKVNSFMKHLFEGENPDGTSVKSTERDIFFDAYPTENQGSILDEDYITPHGKDLTKNPIPIKFLKIKPNVSFKFCFKLFDYKIGDETCVSAAEKCKLFKEIIKLLGVGAKTNVGYGELVDADNKDLKPATQVNPQQNNRGHGGYNNQRNNTYKNHNPTPTQETKPCKKCSAPIPKIGGNYCFKCYSEYKKSQGN